MLITENNVNAVEYVNPLKLLVLLVTSTVYTVSLIAFTAFTGLVLAFFCLSQFFNLSVPDIRGLFFQRAIGIFSVVNSPQSPVFYKIIFCFSLFTIHYSFCQYVKQCLNFKHNLFTEQWTVFIRFLSQYTATPTGKNALYNL